MSALNIFKNAQESARFAVRKSVPIVRTRRIARLFLSLALPVFLPKNNPANEIKPQHPKICAVTVSEFIVTYLEKGN